MSETATNLLGQLLELPPADRLAVADRLWDSLPDTDRDVRVEEVTNDPAFRVELDERLQSIADGTAVLIDGEQVFRELRERLRRGRGE